MFIKIDKDAVINSNSIMTIQKFEDADDRKGVGIATSIVDIESDIEEFVTFKLFFKDSAKRNEFFDSICSVLSVANISQT